MAAAEIEAALKALLEPLAARQSWAHLAAAALARLGQALGRVPALPKTAPPHLTNN